MTMWRFVVLLAAVILGTPLPGTIIVTVATASGVIVASDSRSAGPTGYCDSRTKISVARRKGVPLAIATSGSVLTVRGSPSPYRDTCDMMERGPKIFDLQAESLAFWETQPVVSEETFAKFKSELLSSVQKRLSADPALIDGKPGENVFTVELASFDASTQAFILATFSTIFSEGRSLTTKESIWSEFSSSSPVEISVEGNAAFVNAHMMGPESAIGRAMGATRKRLIEFPVADGLGIAVSIIEDAYRETAKYPGDWNVGGPIRAYIVERTGVRSLR